MSDLMLTAVLSMPYDMAMADDLSRRQFYDRAQQALEEIERLRADAERMDFMEINGLGCDSIGSLGFFVYHNGIRYHGTTARAAIDAAKEQT